MPHTYTEYSSQYSSTLLWNFSLLHTPRTNTNTPASDSYRAHDTWQDKVVPVTGFLHQADINLPYALEGTPRAKDCEVEVKKGIHLTAYVKDVFPNAGRMTLSLDPKINKDKVRCWTGGWVRG